MSIVRHAVFGKDRWPTVYCLTGYTGRIKQYRPYITSLVGSRLRVVAFEYDRDILDAGDPQVLVGALRDIETIIAKDKKDRVVAGVYGVSLGTMLAYNVLYDCGITHAVFNAGGVNVPRAIWERPRLHKVKKAFQKNGYTFESLDKLWAPYDPTRPRTSKQKNTLLLLNSTGDELVDITEARKTVAMWKAQGTTVTLIVIRGLKHAQSIVRHMFRIRRISKFFRQASL
jgi:predicted esterase YcpF (UPF0227 family)